MSVVKELDSLKDLVSHILEQYPETRDSDTLLYIKACEHLGARSFDDIKKLNLNIISIHKLRQQIQNKDKLFPPSDKVREYRKKRRSDIREYMSRLA